MTKTTMAVLTNDDFDSYDIDDYEGNDIYNVGDADDHDNNYDKVNWCLARYSPHATTTNRPTTGH